MSRPAPSDFLLPRDLVAKYDKAGPRYTSYPTAPEWRELAGPEAEDTYRRNNAARAEAPLSLYVHLPFCKKLCYYCGCNMQVTQDQALVSAYLDALETEIDRVSRFVARGDRPVTQIHWGGGTPTYLSVPQLQRVYEALTGRFDLLPDAEVSLELHPAVTSFEQLDALKALGFNRMSMGIQDFDPEVQKAVNRIQPFEETRDLIAHGRGLGFQSVNTDLMYGLPHQTVSKFEKTLGLVLSMRPDRIALFNYAHMPHLRKHMTMIPEAAIPAPEEKLAIFELAIRTLLEAGYRYIGMDHFALPADELAVAQDDGSLRRNFMGYTTRADSDLYAFGASAIADLDDAYLQNDRTAALYIKRVSDGGLPVIRGMPLSHDDRLRREVINRLFCVLKVDKASVSEAFGIDFDAYFAPELAALAPLAEDGLVRLTPEAIRVTPRGQILLRNVAMPFDAYLKRQEPGSRQFSRTL